MKEGREYREREKEQLTRATQYNKDARRERTVKENELKIHCDNIIRLKAEARTENEASRGKRDVVKGRQGNRGMEEKELERHGDRDEWQGKGGVAGDKNWSNTMMGQTDRGKRRCVRNK